MNENLIAVVITILNNQQTIHMLFNLLIFIILKLNFNKFNRI